MPANAGFYYLRRGRAAESFLSLVLERLAEIPRGSVDDDQTVMNKVLVEKPPPMSFSLLDNSTYLCGHTLKTAVQWPGHHLKASKGPASISRDRPVAVVHVNWTGSLAEKKRLLLRGGFWHLCAGQGPEGAEADMRAAGQWYDAEALAGRRRPRNPERRGKGGRAFR